MKIRRHCIYLKVSDISHGGGGSVDGVAVSVVEVLMVWQCLWVVVLMVWQCLWMEVLMVWQCLWW